MYHYSSFFEDDAGNLWVVSEIGLYKYNRAGNKFVCVLGRNAVLPKNRIHIRMCKASADSNGDLWIGGYEYGLIRFSPSDQSFSVQKEGFEHDDVFCVREAMDENGKRLLLVGTNNGVSLLYPQSGQLYNLPDFYNTGVRVKDMFDDHPNGILWIGTSEGVYKYRSRNIGVRTIAIPNMLFGCLPRLQVS